MGGIGGRLILLLSCLGLAACTETLYPRGAEVAPPALLEQSWRTADGVELPLRRWLPEGAPRGVVVALHGMNDYSNAFDAPGKALAVRGFAVYAHDQRGFGAGPHAGHWSGAETMADDLAELSGLLKAGHPGCPLYVLGESMGGAVAMVAAAEGRLAMADGLILAAPAVWGRASMGWFPRTSLWLAHALVPGWTLTGRGLGIQASDNIEMLRALGRDPLVIKETRVDAIKGLVDLMDMAQMAAAKVELPILVLYGEKDQVIPRDPTLAVLARLSHGGRDQRAVLYPQGWHMLLRDLQAKVVIDDMAAWMTDHGAPLPSGADMAVAP